MEKKKYGYLAYIQSQYVRNAEIFKGSENEYCTEAALYDDSMWELDENVRLMLGVFYTNDDSLQEQEILKKQLAEAEKISDDVIVLLPLTSLIGE